MNIVTSFLHRSGGNAVSWWLLNQHPWGYTIVPQYIYENWIIYNHGFLFISQINHPDHKKIPKLVDNHFHLGKGIPITTVVTIEREGIESSNNYINFVTKTFKWSNPKKILILRDYLNWSASAFRMSKNNNINDLDIQKWKEHARKFLISLDGNSQYYPIFYPKWFNSVKYRQKICDDLDLEFTDFGKNTVLPHGGGSSFDSLKYNNKAESMSVLNRYEEMSDNLYFIKKINEYPQAIDLNRKIWSHIEYEM